MTLDAQCGVSADQLRSFSATSFPCRFHARVQRDVRSATRWSSTFMISVRTRISVCTACRRCRAFGRFSPSRCCARGFPSAPLPCAAVMSIRSATRDRLVQTFADQAVIAIENVRLFTELQEKTRVASEAHAQVSEALARETATSEILRVIGSSLTDAQPVFETIARSGLTVCAALGCVVFVVDGDMLRMAATAGVRPERIERFRRDYPISLSAEIDTALAVSGRRMVHLADIANNPNATADDIEVARLAGYRTRLMVPMVRGDRALGLIAVTREDSAAFPDHLVELLRTFADQAVIAIENVRLFTELQARNQDLTATSEILRVISQSQIDVQPVFDIIAESALRLCEAKHGNVFLFDGGLIHLAAVRGHGSRGHRGRAPELPASARRGERHDEGDPDSPVGHHSRRSRGPRLQAHRDGSCCRFPERDVNPDASCRRVDRRDPGRTERRRAVFRRADRHAPDLRRSGGDRH